MNITYVSFDEIPSFKGAAAHILAGLRGCLGKAEIRLISLGSQAIRPNRSFTHLPLNITEKNSLRRGFAFRERVAGLLRRQATDIVHFRSPWEGLPAVRSGLPTVYEVNGLPSVELRYHHRISENAKRIFREWEVECLSLATEIICPSPQIAAFLAKYYPAIENRKIRIFSNGYDPLTSLPERESRKSGTTRFVYLGTLSEWQGVHWSLRAFRSLEGDWTLDVYVPSAKDSVRRFERIVRRYQLGNRVKVFEPLHRSGLYFTLPQYDVAIAPFLKTTRNVEQGCYPLKLLDYLSHGLPVLAPDLPIVRPLLKNGENAFLYSVNNTLNLLHNLQSIVSSYPLPSTMRRQCRESLAGHPTWELYGALLFDLYQNMT